MHRLVLGSVAAVVVLACSAGSGGAGSQGDGGSGSGSSSGSGSGSGSSSGETGSTGVELSVASASAPGMVGGLMPGSGAYFAVLDLTLKNDGAPNALSTNFVLFSLATSQSLVISPSAEQPATGACSATVSVASGGQVECQIAFAVPNEQTPTTLDYNDARGDTASAPVPSFPMASGACNTVEGWTAGTPTAECFSCLESALLGGDAGPSADCAGASSNYHNACMTCGSMCSSLSVDLCSCEVGCDSTSCQALFNTEMSCIESACSSSCM